MWLTHSSPLKIFSFFATVSLAELHHRREQLLLRAALAAQDAEKQRRDLLHALTSQPDDSSDSLDIEIDIHYEPSWAARTHSPSPSPSPDNAPPPVPSKDLEVLAPTTTSLSRISSARITFPTARQADGETSPTSPAYINPTVTRTSAATYASFVDSYRRPPSDPLPPLPTQFQAAGAALARPSSELFEDAHEAPVPAPRRSSAIGADWFGTSDPPSSGDEDAWTIHAVDNPTSCPISDDQEDERSEVDDQKDIEEEEKNYRSVFAPLDTAVPDTPLSWNSFDANIATPPDTGDTLRQGHCSFQSQVSRESDVARASSAAVMYAAAIGELPRSQVETLHSPALVRKMSRDAVQVQRFNSTSRGGVSSGSNLRARRQAKRAAAMNEHPPLPAQVHDTEKQRTVEVLQHPHLLASAGASIQEGDLSLASSRHSTDDAARATASADEQDEAQSSAEIASVLKRSSSVRLSGLLQGFPTPPPSAGACSSGAQDAASPAGSPSHDVRERLRTVEVDRRSDPDDGAGPAILIRRPTLESRLTDRPKSSKDTDRNSHASHVSITSFFASITASRSESPRQLSPSKAIPSRPDSANSTRTFTTAPPTTP